MWKLKLLWSIQKNTCSESQMWSYLYWYIISTNDLIRPGVCLSKAHQILNRATLDSLAWYIGTVAIKIFHLSLLPTLNIHQLHDVISQTQVLLLLKTIRTYKTSQHIYRLHFLWFATSTPIEEILIVEYIFH